MFGTELAHVTLTKNNLLSFFNITFSGINNDTIHGIKQANKNFFLVGHFLINRLRHLAAAYTIVII